MPTSIFRQLVFAVFSVSSLSAATIGPDAFGYSASNVPFNFLNIAGTGTRILGNADDVAQSVEIGFNFGFYGTPQTSAYVSSNGMLAFGTSITSLKPRNLATEAPVSNVPVIAVLWDDWTTVKTRYPASDAVYTQTVGTPGSQQFIVQWNNTFGCCPTGTLPLVFQAILFEGSGNILLQYQQVLSGVGVQSAPGDNGDNGSTAGVGIRDINGHLNGRNLQWSYSPGTAVIPNGSAILFSTSTVVPEPSTFLLCGLGGAALLLARKRRR